MDGGRADGGGPAAGGTTGTRIGPHMKVGVRKPFTFRFKTHVFVGFGISCEDRALL